MKLKTLIYLIFICSTAIGQTDSLNITTINEGDVIIFDCDSDTKGRISKQYHIDSFQELIGFVKSNSTWKFELSFHTDHRGRNKMNMALSKRIAENAVLDLINKFNIDKNQIESNGYGEEKPIITEKTIKSMYSKKSRQQALQINRRFELKALSKITKHKKLNTIC